MKRILCLLLVVAPGVASADKNFLKGKGATWDCKKDPVVNINHGKGTYTFKGACTTINLNGGNSKLTVETVDELNVNGGSNTITVATLGAANLMGSKNKLTYKAAKEGDSANINVMGSDNVVVGPKGATGGTTGGGGGGGAAEPAPATEGGGKVIDCAKTPSFSYQENEGTFTFTGTCDKISLNGNKNTVTADNVKTLLIQGNENKATVNGVDTISTPGNENKISLVK
jgi:hypothetical protein